MLDANALDDFIRFRMGFVRIAEATERHLRVQQALQTIQFYNNTRIVDFQCVDDIQYGRQHFDAVLQPAGIR